MRNVFDQYSQPENRLTHALLTALHQDRSLLIPFLKWVGVKNVPKPKSLTIVEQQVPGDYQPDLSEEEAERRGLPDGAIHDDSEWAVLFESKVQAKVSLGQLNRHRKTAIKHGFASPTVVVISVDPITKELPDYVIAIQWHQIYTWFNAKTSRWARFLAEYMRVFERKMILEKYQIRGTITMFDGLRFNDESPYTYSEGKRLIRLLGDKLQSRSDLKEIGIDPKGERRPAITKGAMGGVWDFLPLKVASGHEFTKFPHLTLGINPNKAIAAITVPNGVRGGFRSKLRDAGMSGFTDLLSHIEKNYRPIVSKSKKSKPIMYVSQRRFRSMRSVPEIDGDLRADLRTATKGHSAKVKYQPQWAEAIYDLLVHKRSNIQFGIEILFSYDCPIVRSEKAVDLFATSWIAMSPLLDFTLKES